MFRRRPVTALLTVLLPLAGCAGEPLAREFQGELAMTRVEAQLAFGPRVPATPGHRAMAAWLDSLSRAVADTVVVQRWTHVTVDGDSLPMVNVIARFNPAATERILYVAHWDTRPRADAFASPDSTLPIPGANDGASGVAILLGVMDALAAQPPTIGVDLLFVDGEDYGSFSAMEDVLIGSTYYAGNILPPGKPDFAVVWDMVGAADLRLPKEPQSAVAAPDVIDLVWGVAERMGYGHIFVQEAGQSVTDDHIPLIQAGVRAIDVIGWPYEHWHTMRDTIDKLSVESLTAVGNVAVAVIREVDRQ